MVYKRSLTLRPLYQCSPDAEPVSLIQQCKDRRYLLRSPDKVLLLLPHQAAWSLLLHNRLLFLLHP